MQASKARLGELAAVGDLHRATEGARASALGLDRLDQVHPLDDLAEHTVLAVQMGGGHGGDEELRAVGVGAGVGHGQESGLGVLLVEVLVRELATYEQPNQQSTKPAINQTNTKPIPSVQNEEDKGPRKGDRKGAKGEVEWAKWVRYVDNMVCAESSRCLCLYGFVANPQHTSLSDL